MTEEEARNRLARLAEAKRNLYHNNPEYKERKKSTSLAYYWRMKEANPELHSGKRGRKPGSKNKSKNVEVPDTLQVPGTPENV